MQSASVAKATATPMHPDDAQFLGALTGAIEKYSNTPSPYAGAQFAGPGALEPVRELGFLPTMEVRPDRAWIDGGSGAYGPGYDGAISAWTSSSLGFGGDVDLNAAAFRSAMNAAPASSWDALSQQADARIAAGTYDRFSDLGHAIVDDGSFSQRAERFAHALTYTRPDAAEQIAAFRSPPNSKAAAFDAMLGGGPFATLAGSAMYASGRSDQDAYFAATVVGSAGGIVGGPAGFQMPRAPQASSFASARGNKIDGPFTPSDIPGAESRVVSFGRNEAVYVVDNGSGLPLRADGLITGPHVGRGKGTLPEPIGGRSAGEHRGHIIPEGGVDTPSYVNNQFNLISEAPRSNLGLKKSIDLQASRLAAENPNSVIRFIGEPVRNIGETRPFAMTYYITKDGQVVQALSVFNK
ncbi:hypothetical protein [Burkholderia stagnalis]|uniref:hypothetical protein n=1 Tax=Burkholderia stagnalis TaxID=1503054 RepID=UPI000F5D7385|nr:hypothetical protein [Burkholderia stagnalis]